MYQILLKSGLMLYTDVRDFVNDIQRRKESGENGIVPHEFGLLVDSSEVSAISPITTNAQS